jgi:uncharacterized DUF497 family protein
LKPVKIRGIIWLDEIVEKLASKHHVSRNEVRDVLQSRTAKFRFVENGMETGEDVYSAAGRTVAGRFLIVFFLKKTGDRALTISARDMTTAERRRYEKK